MARRLSMRTDFAAWMKKHAKPVIASVAALAAAVISLLTALNAVHWSAAQIAVVTAETAAAIALVTAVAAHFWPETKQEPVALAASFTAFVTGTLTLGTGFSWWALSEAQVASVVAVVSATLGVFSAFLARSQVRARETPASHQAPVTSITRVPPAAPGSIPGAGGGA